MRIDPKQYGDRREVPKYRVADVALYLGIKESTLRDWCFGRAYSVRGERRVSPRLILPAADNPYGPSLSFYNLAEAQVLAATRQKWQIRPPSEPVAPGARPKFGERSGKPSVVQVSMQAIRSAIDYLSPMAPIHPLLSQYFYTDGKHLFVRQIEETTGHLVVNASLYGQLGLADILDVYLERLDRDKVTHEPIKVYPMRQVDDSDRTIVILPNVASGRPTINGTGIRVESIWSRAKAGETTDELANDYGIEPQIIEKAISYFTSVRAA